MELDRLNENELPELERRSKQLSSQVSALKVQTESLESQCTQLRTDENSARNCVADVVAIDRLQVSTVAAAYRVTVKLWTAESAGASYSHCKPRPIVILINND